MSNPDQHTSVPWGILALIGGGLLLGFLVGKARGEEEFDDEDPNEYEDDEDPTEDDEEAA